jgi:hypothetical protein
VFLSATKTSLHSPCYPITPFLSRKIKKIEKNEKKLEAVTAGAAGLGRSLIIFACQHFVNIFPCKSST